MKNSLEYIKEYLNILKPEELKNLLQEITLQDLIENWDTLTQDEGIHIFKSLNLEMKVDLINSLTYKEQELLLQALNVENIRQLLNEMEPDDLVDFIQSVSHEVRKSVWDNLSPEAKKETLFLLKFDEDDAAGLMTPRYIAIKPSITVAQALKFVRKGAEEIETVYYFYVLDQVKRLIGVVSLRDILAAKDEQIISEIMETDIISVQEETDQEEVARILETYSLLAVPVVDRNNLLLGIVTFDDVIEVIHEEQTEDVYKMVAIGGKPLPYLETSVLGLVKKRIPWLIVLLIVGTITTNVLHHYEDIILGAAFLFMFMPVITQTGGNAASQSSALMIRGLATEEISFKDLWKVLGIEMAVGCIMGIGTGLVVFVRGIFLPPGIQLFQSFAISLSLCFVVVFSTIIGAFAPLLIHRMGHDPTVMSGPLMATLIDVCGLTIYFELARYLLNI